MCATPALVVVALGRLVGVVVEPAPPPPHAAAVTTTAMTSRPNALALMRQPTVQRIDGGPVFVSTMLAGFTPSGTGNATQPRTQSPRRNGAALVALRTGAR